jgi:signal peptidase I
MCRVTRISGDSIAPVLRNGDFVVALPPSFLRPGLGDCVVFEAAGYGRLVKIVSKIEPAGYLVRGTRPQSTGSRELGVVARNAIIGVVIVSITPNGIRRRSRIRRVSLRVLTVGVMNRHSPSAHVIDERQGIFA